MHDVRALPSEECVTGSDTIIHDDPIQHSRDLAVTIADVLADTPASDTRVIDIHELTHIADLFVICSGDNERQLRAILRLVHEQLKEHGIDPVRIEGDPTSGWILMDFQDVIVHVFDKDIRAFYNLEERWAEAPVVLAIQ